MPSSQEAAPDPSPEKTIRITAKIHLVALAAVLFFTALNGLFNALNFEYSRKHTTFLAAPEDAHADLIRSALSLPPYVPAFMPGRDDAWRYLYVNNPYHTAQAPQRNKLTALHVTPIMIVSMLLLKRMIMVLGAGRVIHLFYAIAFISLAFICWKFCRSFREALFVFATLALSYPFLMILCRANPGGLLVSICLILFLRELFVGHRVAIPALLLAVACNCRPNAVLLLPLLLFLGWRRGLRELVVFGFTAAALLLASYGLATHFDRDYNFTSAGKAIQVYYRLYVLDGAGSNFNNSAFAAVWMAVDALHLMPQFRANILVAIQWMIDPVFPILLALFSFLYLRRQIDKYECAFAIGSLYILGSTMFVTYHLFFLVFFILVVGLDSFHLEPRRGRYLILATSIFLLIPKSYFFHRGVSFEAVLNPLALVLALALIYRWRAPAPARKRFRDTLNWERDPQPLPS
jgi:hypothetical protein